MPICAYCRIEQPKLTKEHLWPAALHARIDKSNLAAYDEKNQFYLAKIDKMVEGEPQIRDVCGTCNNGPLSKLDEYICKLWDVSFRHILPPNAQVAFEFDYHRLVRWLLKMCFNSARVHNSDTSHLQKCCEYILTGNSQPEHVHVHVQLTAPTTLSEEQLVVMRSHGLADDKYEPRHNRVGHLAYQTRFGHRRLLRAVHLQSFMFLIHLFPDKIGDRQRRAELRDLALQFPYAKRLRAKESATRTTLICAGVDALASMGSHFETKGLAQ